MVHAQLHCCCDKSVQFGPCVLDGSPAVLLLNDCHLGDYGLFSIWLVVCVIRQQCCSFQHLLSVCWTQSSLTEMQWVVTVECRLSTAQIWLQSKRIDALAAHPGTAKTAIWDKMDKNKVEGVAFDLTAKVISAKYAYLLFWLASK